MQFTTLLFTALGVTAATAASVDINARAQQSCNGQLYDPSKYTCFGKLLCPILNGVIYQPCGNACYDPANYECDGGKLNPVSTCNGQRFDKNTYVCVQNHLCPKQFPNLCGDNPGACYSTSQYKCVNGQLQQV